MKVVLVLTLLLGAMYSSAATLSPSKPGRLRLLMQERLPRWQATLGSTLAAGILLFSSPVAAQDGGAQPQGQWREANHAEHSAVLNLVLTFKGTRRSIHIVHVGEDRQARALFLGLRFGFMAIPTAEAESILGIADAWLFDRSGLARRDAEVWEVESFFRPDAEQVRLHDITLVAIEGLNTSDYHVAPLDDFPKLGESLTSVDYRTQLVPERERLNWIELHAAAPLTQEDCIAFSFAPDLWSAHGNCGRREATTPIFNAAGKLVGFNLAAGEIVVIPPQVRTYLLEERFGVSAKRKLPLTWGAIKGGAY